MNKDNKNLKYTNNNNQFNKNPQKKIPRTMTMNDKAKQKVFLKSSDSSPKKTNNYDDTFIEEFNVVNIDNNENFEKVEIYNNHIKDLKDINNDQLIEYKEETIINVKIILFFINL
jgi:hypothetical protein